MTSSAPTLQEQRQLLVARSAVQRLEIAQGLGQVRNSLRGPRLAFVAGGLGLGVAGLGRIGRVIRAAALGVALFNVARMLFRR